MATPATTSSRRTGDELIQAVHAAALAEISENGLRRASMDRIAKRAGTGKAALYRRWPNVRALGLDVFLATIAESVPQAFPNTGSLREDLVGSMKSFTSSFRGPMALVLRELISESAHDPELIEEFNRRLGEPMQPARGRANHNEPITRVRGPQCSAVGAFDKNLGNSSARTPIKLCANASRLL